MLYISVTVGNVRGACTMVTFGRYILAGGVQCLFGVALLGSRTWGILFFGYLSTFGGRQATVSFTCLLPLYSSFVYVYLWNLGTPVHRGAPPDVFLGTPSQGHKSIYSGFQKKIYRYMKHSGGPHVV